MKIELLNNNKALELKYLRHINMHNTMLKTSGIEAGKFYREAQWFILGDNRMNTKYYQEAAWK